MFRPAHPPGPAFPSNLEFYLQHRYSEDLDFFTERVEIFLPAVQALEGALDRAGLEHQAVRRLATFAELRILCQQVWIQETSSCHAPAAWGWSWPRM
jgi:hypothetical protein